MRLCFYEDSEYLQIVLNTISMLEIKDKFTFKDIRLNHDYAKEIVELTGDVIVPCLITQDGPMKERYPEISCFTFFVILLSMNHSEDMDHRSKRSRFITLSHAATKSLTNFCCASSLA